MKTFARLLLFTVLLAPAAFAHWADVHEGMTANEVCNHCGSPLLETRGHGMIMWIYDRGGQVIFSHGYVLFFTAPDKGAERINSQSP